MAFCGTHNHANRDVQGNLLAAAFKGNRSVNPYRCIPWVHRRLMFRAFALRLGQGPVHFPRRLPPQPRTTALPLQVLRHSPNPHPLSSTILAGRLTAPPILHPSPFLGCAVLSQQRCYRPKSIAPDSGSRSQRGWVKLSSHCAVVSCRLASCCSRSCHLQGLLSSAQPSSRSVSSSRWASLCRWASFLACGKV